MKRTIEIGAEIAVKNMLIFASTALKSLSKMLMIFPIYCCCAV